MDAAFAPNKMQKSKLDYSKGSRKEKDLLGEREVPADAYFGVQTLRAIETYNITGILVRNFPEFIIAFAQVKKACAKANFKLGLLEEEKTEAICRACDELIDPESAMYEDNKGKE